MTGPRIGELFAGYGGLGQGVQAVLGGEIAWFSEFDKAPSKILAHHWPDVPNHGDITLIDWSTVEPVDILTGGFPCQDVSLAGARRGLKDGTRSGLWSYFAEAIGALKPELVVIENVRGLLSADASSGVESCPECVGDGPDAVSLRALGAVLGDLADIGYDAEWAGVRAADAGAPHGRFRVFVLAYPSSSRGGILADRTSRDETRSGGYGEPDGSDRVLADANPAHLGHERGRRTRDRGAGLENSGESATNPSRDESERRGRVSDLRSTTTTGEVDSEERQRVRDTASDRRAVATDTGCERGHESDDVAGISREITNRATVVDEHRPRSGGTEWGVYRPAIERWASVLGRDAPAPTRGDGRDGGHRLSADFVEWMMGLDAGHVTDVGLTRNEQLKALGNGVVPQQAEMALRVLLGRMTQPTMKGAA